MDEKNFRLAQSLSDGVLSISSNETFWEKALGILKNEERPIPLATWLPFTFSEERLASYVQMMSPQLPESFLEMAERRPEGLGIDELVDIFTIIEEEDLEQKVKRLEKVGVSEVIFEYFALDELGTLASELKKHS